MGLVNHFAKAVRDNHIRSPIVIIATKEVCHSAVQ